MIFFVKQNAAYDLRISDWSSDVCSSDLPDVVGYGHRDYGNRVGHWRMAEAMSKHGFPGSVSLSVAMCQHLPKVVEDANARGWEFFSHGIYNTRYSYGMDEAQERALIEDSICKIGRAHV